MGLYSRLTTTPCMKPLYSVLHEPLRQYNVDDVLDFTSYITNSSWGLESVYCRSNSTRFMAIIDGEAALTKEQVKSSVACFAFGTIMTLLFVVSLLVWFGGSTSAIIFIVVTYTLLVMGSLKRTVGLASVYKKVFKDDHKVNLGTKSEALYIIQETFRVSEPRRELYWFLLACELILFGLIPLISLFSAGNNRVGIVFIVLFLFAMLRDVCNAPGKI